MNDKRGMQHVEFIVSFIIFITFLGLAFYFFSPVRGDRIVDSALFYTADEIAKNVSVSIESFSVNIKGLEVPDSVAIPFPEQSGLKARVEDVNGNVLTSGFDGLNVHISRNGNNFFVVSFSEDFSPGNYNGGDVLIVDDYVVSSSEIREVYSEEKLKALEGIYSTEEGYNKLKDDFNLPSRGSFGFTVGEGDNKISAERNIPEGLEVFSQNEKVELLRKTGRVDFVDFSVLIW